MTSETTKDAFVLDHFKGEHWEELGIRGVAPYRVWRITGQRPRRVMGWRDWWHRNYREESVRQVIYSVTKETMDPIQKFLRLKDAKQFAYLLATGEDE